MIRRADPIFADRESAAAQSALEQLVLSGATLRRITVDEYHRMLDAGILQSGDPYELLNGYIVRKDRSAAGEDPLTVGDQHAWAIQALVDLNPKLRRLGSHLRIQLPIALPPDHEPEPDGAIVRGTKDNYRGSKPRAADIFCIIEVSDSSLDRDRTVKLAVYAEGGIEQYVIVNLAEKVVEVYTAPLADRRRYGRVEIYRARQRLSLAAGTKACSVSVRELLP